MFLNTKNKSRKQHWENVYQTKDPAEVSWHKTNPQTSIDLILSARPDQNINIIDVGGGDSVLVDKLIALEFKNIFILDISAKALKKSRHRLGRKAKSVHWIESDILDFDTDHRFDVWHDWAAFHFLTHAGDIEKYFERARTLINPGGYLIIAAFSTEGPKKCSGLNITRYSEDSIRKVFTEGFMHVKSIREDHTTPFQTKQNFLYSVFKRTYP